MAANIICLSPTAHTYWNKGYFVLHPTFLSADKKTLVITFYWQVKFNGNEDVNLQTQPPSTRDLENNGDSRVGLAVFGDAFHKIKSAETFTITTDDPVKLPLPSFELLRLQFFLQRVAGMAGAAEPVDLEEWGDDDKASDAGGIEGLEEWEEGEELEEEDCEGGDPDVTNPDVSPLELGMKDVPELSFADTSLETEGSLLESPAKAMHGTPAPTAGTTAERPKHEGEVERQGQGEGEGEEGLVRP